MKRMILMVLLSISVSAVASDGQNKIFALLNQNETATELDWRNKKLGNRDFEGLGIVSHVKKLDLSDNDFSGDFPLTACLRAFPNLETLSINNNTRVTGLSIDNGYKNTTLKVLNVENSGCAKVPVSDFYKKFELETLDLSESKQLTRFYSAMVPRELRASRKPFCVHIRNVVMEENELNRITKNGVVETGALWAIEFASAIGTSVVGNALLFSSCIFLCPYYYCVQGPIPSFPTTNVFINSGVVSILSMVVGLRYLGGAIARRVLPNGGKVTAVKYITSSVDEAV
jgi:hypothetical protein